jgi:hypothetical protein
MEDGIALQILIWGLVIGAIHFVAVGILYMNPLVAKMYKSENDNPAVRKWSKQGEYVLKMALGTQVEVFILTAAYVYLRMLFPSPDGWATALILGEYSRASGFIPVFRNMSGSSSDLNPGKLFSPSKIVNGVIGTFVIVLGLKLMPF